MTTAMATTTTIATAATTRRVRDMNSLVPASYRRTPGTLLSVSHAPPASKLEPAKARDTMESDEPKFTWKDLIVDNVTPGEGSAWLAPWNWLVSGRVYPLFRSRFGNWFLRRLDGSTDLLDVHEGIVGPVAATPKAFG